MISSTARPVAIDRARLERQTKELALDHAAGRISDDAYLGQVHDLRTRLAALDDGTSRGVTAERAVAWLRALGETIVLADVPDAKAELVHAVYERIVVMGPEIISARLSPTAYQHGLALALPQVVMASPAGLEPATDRLEGGCSVH